MAKTAIGRQFGGRLPVARNAEERILAFAVQAKLDKMRLKTVLLSHSLKRKMARRKMNWETARPQAL